MRPRLFTVGLICDGEVTAFGPFSKATAEDLFRRLTANPPEGATVFLQPLRSLGGRPSWLPRQ